MLTRASVETNRKRCFEINASYYARPASPSKKLTKVGGNVRRQTPRQRLVPTPNLQPINKNFLQTARAGAQAN
jgi:hypothetical protein